MNHVQSLGTMDEYLQSRKWCYSSVRGRLVAVVQGETGFYPLSDDDSLPIEGDDARARALNHERGITQPEADEMVFASMRKS